MCTQPHASVCVSFLALLELLRLGLNCSLFKKLQPLQNQHPPRRVIALCALVCQIAAAGFWLKRLLASKATTGMHDHRPTRSFRDGP
jgi:hypothetical protein